MAPSIWQLLIVLGIVVVIFGTGKLRTIGGDLGGAIRSFRKSMTESGDEGEGSASSDKDDRESPKLEADPLERSESPLESEAGGEKQRAASGDASR